MSTLDTRLSVRSRLRAQASLTRLEQHLAASFIKAVHEARRRTPVEATALEAAQAIEIEIESYSDALLQAYVRIGEHEIARLSRRLGVPMRFDPMHPPTSRMLAGLRLKFLLDFARSQRRSVLQSVNRVPVDAMAMQKRDVRGPARRALGLTPYQEQIVENYRIALIQGSANALERRLRDRRFDPTVDRVVHGGDPLTWGQIDRMTQRYRERWLAYRARVQAKSQALFAFNSARHMALLQAINQANYDSTLIIRTWNAVMDEATRDSHYSMDGLDVQGMQTPFESPSGALLLYPGDLSAPPEETVGCRCWLTYSLPGEDEDEEEWL